jgi:serine protease Do
MWPLSLIAVAIPLSALQPERGLQTLSAAFEDLTRRVSSSVVQIYMSGSGFAYDPDAAVAGLTPRQTGSGSGVIVDPDGYIVTNGHVVEGASKVLVALARSERPRDARIIGIDKELDLAVLKIEGTGLRAISFGDSDQVRAGQIVLALGSPLGLRNSITMGVVSATARYLDNEDLVPYIQTDATINPGNSGGPLLNVEGKLIGISTFILSHSGGSEGVGFAIPSNIVRSTYQQLRKYGRVRRGDIGIHAETVNPAMAAGLGLARDTGVIAADVFPDSSAEGAGVRPGDMLVSLDGRPLDDARQFDLFLTHRTEGEQVKLTVLRGAQRMDFTVPVHERSEDEDRFAEFADPQKHLVAQLGVLCIAIDGKIREAIGPLRFPHGVLVAARAPDPQGQEIDLHAGDVVYSLNNQTVHSVDGLRKLLARLKPGDAAALQIERDETLHYIAFRLE